MNISNDDILFAFSKYFVYINSVGREVVGQLSCVAFIY